MSDETPELPKLSGPTLEPLGGRTPKQLVILCHGVGSDGDDLMGLAPFFQKVLPDARFVSPHAPFQFDGGPVGIDSLAAALSEERGTLEDVIEPYLIQQGLIVRTPRGRVATNSAYRHFGLSIPTQDKAESPQMSLDDLDNA